MKKIALVSLPQSTLKTVVKFTTLSNHDYLERTGSDRIDNHSVAYALVPQSYFLQALQSSFERGYSQLAVFQLLNDGVDDVVRELFGQSFEVFLKCRMEFNVDHQGQVDDGAQLLRSS